MARNVEHSNLENDASGRASILGVYSFVVVLLIGVMCFLFIFCTPFKWIYSLQKDPDPRWPNDVYFCNAELGAPIGNVSTNVNWTHRYFSCSAHKTQIAPYCCVAIHPPESFGTLGVYFDVCPFCYKTNSTGITPGAFITFDDPCNGNFLGFVSQGFYNAMFFEKRLNNKPPYTVYSAGVIAWIEPETQSPVKSVAVTLSPLPSSLSLMKEP